MNALFPEHLIDSRPVPYERLKADWNAMAATCGLAQIKFMHDKRKAKLRARWKETDFRLYWPALMETVPKIPFLIGKNARGWRITFDFVIRSDETYHNIIEGKYGEPTDSAPPVTPEDIARQADALAVYENGKEQS
jgi:hypothetical protein